MSAYQSDWSERDYLPTGSAAPSSRRRGWLAPLGALLLVAIVASMALWSSTTTPMAHNEAAMASGATPAAASLSLQLAQHSGSDDEHEHKKKKDKEAEEVSPASSSLQSSPSLCEDPNYSRVTLKTAHERAMVALFSDLGGEKKFEASDVIRVGSHYLVVYDNLYHIGRIDQQLDFYSDKHELIRSDPPRDGDSGFEAIVHDEQTGVYYVVIESAMDQQDEFHSASLSALSNATKSGAKRERKFHAYIEELDLTLPQAGKEGPTTYQLRDRCRTEFTFKFGNKGFEGAVLVHAELGNNTDELIFIGLCEGNHCAGGSRGRDSGNGRLVLMRKDGGDAHSDCIWRTVGLLALPPKAAFLDYSAIALRAVDDSKHQHAVSHRASVYQLAVTSQESSQVWLGELRTGIAADASDWSLTDGVVYNFPRSDTCQTVYCNIEGVSFIDENLLVAVSDKMKSGGRQHFACLEKDQSIHTFVLP